MIFHMSVAGSGATYAFRHAAPGAQIFLSEIVPWATSFFSLTFGTNIICTFLIGSRILTIQRTLKGIKSGGSNTQSALITVAESAALYSATVLALLIAYLQDSNVQYILLDIVSPMIGITFSIIIVRVSLGVAAQNSTFYSTNQISQPETHELSRIRPLAVNVSHLVEMSDDDPNITYIEGQVKDVHSLGLS